MTDIAGRFGLFAIDCPATGEAIGQWVKSYDPDAYDGAGHVAFTATVSAALSFDTAQAAMAEWMRVSTVRPERLDGKPNRPLSAYSVSALPLDKPVPAFMRPR